MSQRERQPSGGVSAAGQPGPLSAAAPLASAGLPWEEIYPSASPAQQAELLALAARQGGLVYSHQLPASANGLLRDPARELLTRLLAGKTDDLEPLHVQPTEVEDAALDPVQREAVAKALQTPDLCLIQGLPGTGKTRVLAEIITRAAVRGERVLLLAPHAATLDRALHLIRDREAIYAVRCLDREENPESLPPSLRELTFAERLRRLREDTLEAARRDIQAAEARSAQLARGELLWPRLEELAERRRQLDEQLDALRDCRGQVADLAEQEVRQAESATGDHPLRPALDALRLELNESLARIEKVREDLTAQVKEHEREQAMLAAELDRLRPLAEAKQSGRWWTFAWWRAVFSRTQLARLAACEARLGQLGEALNRLKEEARRLDKDKERSEQVFQEGRARVVESAAARRRAELDDEEAALRHEAALIQEKWQAACQEFGSEAAPTAPTPAALRAAREAWQQRVREAEERRAFARQWAACLEESAATLANRMREYVNVVAATTGSLAADEHFGDAAAPLLFDLLVLEGANQVTESEFVNLARRARRWVLVGEPAPEEGDLEGEGQATDRKGKGDPARPSPPLPSRGTAAAPPAPASGEKGKGEGTSRRPVSARSPIIDPRASFFQRLWHQLHCDPRRLPYAWVHDKDGLCCRLRPLPPEQRPWLECERVADFPDVELRILAPPRTPPVLAEVVFPPWMSIAQAKAYIFHELAELPVRAERHSLRWLEQPERLVLSLADSPPADAVPVVLGHGVREWVAVRTAGSEGGESHPTSWHTCLVEFDRRAGWHRRQAEEWVQQHLGIRDLGRTVRLDIPYRMHPELAAFLSDWLFAGAYDLPPAAPELAPLLSGNGTPAVQFVPVPSPAADRSSRRRSEVAARSGDGRRGTVMLRPAKAGAGLELDAGDPRHRDRLPAELRADFSGTGFVNYLEAQAVVRTLQALIADPALQAAAQPCGDDPHRVTIGVLALYPAQAELIRRLMARVPSLAPLPGRHGDTETRRQGEDGSCSVSPCLPVSLSSSRSKGITIKVDVPAAFREGECLVGLVSLTRSHSHRAVSFGEGPDLLVRALTRARARLIIFGDPGTLARRAQWQGALDHLDEFASAWEQRLISRLVGYLHGQGAPSPRFQLCEGSAP
ncbi:MAG TPA: AAA domain-containing protein [Gemmataceae bacterium]|nr:AAA domain-containing protein [Gemmataceae bacterium]